MVAKSLLLKAWKIAPPGSSELRAAFNPPSLAADTFGFVAKGGRCSVESTRYVLIPCRTCGSQMFVIGERPLPKRCTRCGAAFDPERRAFDVRSAPRVTVRT
jgi:hypothetical protein